MAESIIAQLLAGAIQCYRRWVSPLLGPRCRFYPSCSEYALSCLAHDGLGQALFRIGRRLLRCHPFHPGGVDLP